MKKSLLLFLLCVPTTLFAQRVSMREYYDAADTIAIKNMFMSDWNDSTLEYGECYSDWRGQGQPFWLFSANGEQPDSVTFTIRVPYKLHFSIIGGDNPNNWDAIVDTVGPFDWREYTFSTIDPYGAHKHFGFYGIAIPLYVPHPDGSLTNNMTNAPLYLGRAYMTLRKAAVKYSGIPNASNAPNTSNDKECWYNELGLADSIHGVIRH